MSNTVPDWLLTKTFAVQFNPNCAKPFLVRLVDPDMGQLDMKPYAVGGVENPDLTKDVLGFGMTLKEAAEQALIVLVGKKPSRKTQG